MKIEYLSDTNPAHPKDAILRAFDFDSSEACEFRDVLRRLSDGSLSEILLNDLPFFTAVGGCHLVLKVGSRDEGIIAKSGNDFECILKKNTWEDAVCLVEPFCEEDLSGYQWLYDLNTDIEFLFSPNGNW